VALDRAVRLTRTKFTRNAGFLTELPHPAYMYGMDSAMRDLEQIQERDDDTPTRKVAMLVMAALSTVGLVFAMGVLLRDGSAASQAEEDPLSRLDALDLAADGGARARAKPDVEEEPAPALTFHSALTQPKNPDLAAAVAAADAELAALDDREPHPARAVALALTELPETDVLVTEPEARARPTKRAATVEIDRSDEGRTGYALQVVSYKNPAEAQTFAKELERRSHPVFVERAVIEGRGEFYRVRVGPFDTRGEAARHRARFEESERIHTLLVRL
jgi:DedD protein